MMRHDQLGAVVHALGAGHSLNVLRDSGVRVDAGPRMSAKPFVP